MELNECQNCQAKIKKGMFGENKVISNPNIVYLINKYTKADSESYCTDCYLSLLDQASSEAKRELSKKQSFIEQNAASVPIITTHTPLNWDYKAVEIVTAQTTTGTGVISEFTSGFTDFFGAQSGAYNRKLVSGEESCFTQLRLKALKLGANAIIATDIDYAEVGGAKGMLMICMAGTAVKLKNTDIIGSERAEKIKETFDAIEKLPIYNSDLEKYEAIKNIPSSSR